MTLISQMFSNLCRGSLHHELGLQRCLLFKTANALISGSRPFIGHSCFNCDGVNVQPLKQFNCNWSLGIGEDK
jgi:hypothetical protein